MHPRTGWSIPKTVINRQKEELASKNNRLKEHTKDIAAISDGLKSLYYILNDEEDLKLDKHQIENITKCYRLIDEDFVSLLEHLKGKPITPKEEMLSILWRIGKDKESVMKILGLSKDGYRQLKFRTLKKLKQETSFKRFCDNLEWFNENSKLYLTLYQALKQYARITPYCLFHEKALSLRQIIHN